MNQAMRKISIFAFSIILISQGTTVAHASWGAQRLLQQQNQTVATAPSPATSTQPQRQTQTQPQPRPQPQQSTTAPTQTSNQSTADAIRAMRGGTQPAPAPQQPTNNQTNTNTTRPAPTAPQPTAPTSNQTNLSSMESSMLEMVNQARREAGVAPLQLHSQLTSVARVKSQDMVDNNYFAHTSPTHGSFYHMVSNAGIPYRQVGENLAKAGDVRRAHMMLMGSEGHKKNLLSPSFTHIGIGISRDTHGIVVTQLFIAQ